MTNERPASLVNLLTYSTVYERYLFVYEIITYDGAKQPRCGEAAVKHQPYWYAIHTSDRCVVGCAAG